MDVALDGCGYGYGCGYGDGDVDGSGYGYGCGCGDGDGSGYGETQLEIPAATPWQAYHYIRHDGCGRFILRNGMPVAINVPLHEHAIEMCSCGLHASLSPEDAKKYAPSGSVLTRVDVWGTIIVGKDKLVATDRKIVEVM